MALEEKICGENGNCLYCGSPLSSEGVVYCSRCVTPHHQDCFAEAGCSIFACGGKESSDTPDRYSQIADQAATTLPATVPVSTPSLVQQVGCALRYRFDHIDSDRIVSKFRKFDHAKPFKENCRPNNLEGSLRAYSRSIFVMIRGLFDRMSEESCYPTDLDKTVTREFPVFYDTYTDQIARQIKELMSLGFKSCPIPETKSVWVKDPGIIHAPKGWWAISDGVRSYDQYKTEGFPVILRFIDNSERLLGERVDRSSLWGMTGDDMKKADDELKRAYAANRTARMDGPAAIYVYLIGRLEPRTFEEPKSEQELSDEINLCKFRTIFGRDPWRIDDLQTILLGHGDQPQYQLRFCETDHVTQVSESQVQVYAAAMESGLFDKLEWAYVSIRPPFFNAKPPTQKHLLVGTIQGLMAPLDIDYTKPKI